MTITEPGGGWRQVTLWFTDWRTAEEMAATHLAPLLSTAQDRGDITASWFVRKGPSWRLRLQPGHAASCAATSDVVVRTMDQLIGQGAAQRWVEQVYEPETHAFGGPSAMDIAHELFSTDSHHLLAHLTRTYSLSGATGPGPDDRCPVDQRPGDHRRGDHRPPDHRRELGMLLGTRLLRAAGLDWYEQGDVWHRLAAHRTLTDTTAGAANTGASPTPGTVRAVGQLLSAVADSPTSPLHDDPAWPTAFEHAGQALAELARSGLLSRGLRAVLTHHLLFALNRLGVSAEHQYVLASAAARFVFQEEHVSHHPSHTHSPSTTNAAPETAHTSDTKLSAGTGSVLAGPAGEATVSEAGRLREGLVDYIRGRGTFRTPQVEHAFRTVPRHLFLPGVDLAETYAPRPVVTKRAANGTAISSASSPNLVAGMLELLGAAPGHRVLEIGAATGINAALLAELVGPQGQVVTIEIDDDLAAGARIALTAAGYPQVEVICGDGALGHPAAAPYDRIIVTAGAWDIPTTWWQQLALGGRLVVPVRLHGSGLTRVLPFDRARTDRMVATIALVSGFVPMRGADAHPENVVRLAEDVVLAIDTADHPDTSALARALRYPAQQRWTGIHVRHDEPAEHLDLWLATTTAADGASFGRLSVSRAARDSGFVDPAMRWAGAALYTGGTLAYLTARTHTDDADELGITAHGPDADTLTDQLGTLLHHWGEQRPSQPTITATPDPSHVRPHRPALDTDTDTDTGTGVDVVRDHTQLAITW